MAARRTVAASRPISLSSSLIRQATVPALAKSPPLTGNSCRKTASAAMPALPEQPGEPGTGVEHAELGGDDRQPALAGLPEDLSVRTLPLDEDDGGEVGQTGCAYDVRVDEAGHEEGAGFGGRQDVAHEVGGED